MAYSETVGKRDLFIYGEKFRVSKYAGEQLGGELVGFHLCHVRSGEESGGMEECGTMPDGRETRVARDQVRTGRRVVCAAACFERDVRFIPRHLIGRFLAEHDHRVFVMHGVGVLFWVLDEYLREFDREARELWWDLADRGLLRDIQILDQLLGLARVDRQPSPNSFSQIVEDHLSMEFAYGESDNNRLARAIHRRGEFADVCDNICPLPASFEEARGGRPRRKKQPQRPSLHSPAHLFAYAFGDRKGEELLLDVPISLAAAEARLPFQGPTAWTDFWLDDPELIAATAEYPALLCTLYSKMFSEAFVIMEPYSNEILQGAILSYGPLSEVIQVKAALTIPLMTIHGLHADVPVTKALQQQMRAQLVDCTQRILSLPHCSDLFHLDSRGDIKISKISGKPSMIQTNLLRRLIMAVEDVKQNTGIAIPIPQMPGHGKQASVLIDGDEGDPLEAVSLSRSKWKTYVSLDPFIRAWVELEQTAKVNSFAAELGAEVVHPKYTIMLRNGRTSCSSPNIQQVPRQCGMRSLFKASPGHLFISCDYSFIELCTLAAVCENRYGYSQLADVIRKGIDPHAYTAAMFEKMALEEFLKLKSSPDPDQRKRYANLRQRAKAINFGIPGGQGAAALQGYALSAYGVELTLEEARLFRQKVVYKVYPELSRYLYEDKRHIQQLAYRIGSRPKDCWETFKILAGERPIAIAGAVKNVIRGYPFDGENRPYPQEFVNGVWKGLLSLCTNPEVANLLKQAGGHGSEELEEKIFGADVVTMSGRMRGGVSFTQACNTPFSGLAADGAKVAIWELTLAGYRVVAFVHDEILVEVPIGCDYTREADIIARTMCMAMEEVCGSVPIKCKYALSETWSREAEPVFDEEGRLVPWTEDMLPPVRETTRAKTLRELHQEMENRVVNAALHVVHHTFGDLE